MRKFQTAVQLLKTTYHLVMKGNRTRRSLPKGVQNNTDNKNVCLSLKNLSKFKKVYAKGWQDKDEVSYNTGILRWYLRVML